MKYLGYIFIGFIVYLAVEILSINLGNALGSGTYDIGLIVTAISLLCGIVVICTLIIVDAIKSQNN